MAKWPSTPSACVRASARRSPRYRERKADGSHACENHRAPGHRRERVAVPAMPREPVEDDPQQPILVIELGRGEGRRPGLARLQHRLDPLDDHRPDPGPAPDRPALPRVLAGFARSSRSGRPDTPARPEPAIVHGFRAFEEVHECRDRLDRTRSTLVHFLKQALGNRGADGAAPPGRRAISVGVESAAPGGMRTGREVRPRDGISPAVETA